jgi:hypothetical protein
MAKLAIKKASTDVTVYVFIQDSSKTTGAGLTGLVYNTTDLVASYVRPLAARAALSLATLAAVDSAHSDGGFKEIDATNMPGVYRLDLPDAVCATGVNSVVVMLKGAANMAPVVLEIQLTDFDLNDASPNVTVADIANDAITAAAYDESTAFPIKKADATTTELARLDSASSYKADVSGLATPTNITAGTITTVTNLTNLPNGTGANQISLSGGKVLLQATQSGVTIPTVTAITNGVSLADDAITSAKFDESTAFPVKKADALTTELARLDSAASYKADVSAITGAALSSAGIDAILDEVVVGTYTMRQLLAVMGAALAGKVTGGGTTAITFRGINDASNVIVATVDANGNRSAVTVTV